MRGMINYPDYGDVFIGEERRWRPKPTANNRVGEGTVVDIEVRVGTSLGGYPMYININAHAFWDTNRYVFITNGMWFNGMTDVSIEIDNNVRILAVY